MTRSRLDCPPINALLGLLAKPARSQREFTTMCGTTAETARKTQALLHQLRLIRVEETERGTLVVKRVELTTKGQQVAKHYQEAERLMGQGDP